MNTRWSRRGVVRTAGSGIAGLAVLGTAGTSVGQTDSKASITFADQASDGSSVTIDTIETDVAARFVLRNRELGEVGGPVSFDAGAVVEDYAVELTTEITEAKTLSANLYNSEGQNIARETADIIIGESSDLVPGFGPKLVEADPAFGFNYPYYLYAPSKTTGSDPGSILIEPNNSGETTDEFEVQRQSAASRISGGTSREISDRLTVPLLVPVFPRPQSDPVDWRHYIHALDRQTMQISDGPLERVDLQLLRMADHARELLSEQSYAVDDQLLLNGFSASGNFVDRFAVLHPDRVRSVTAGGLNGMAMLPLAEAEGRTLDYHIGIADVEELTGEPVDVDALDGVNQFLFMGSADGNDTIPYDDAWSEGMREVALEVYGEEMITERFPYCQSAYEQAGVDAQFKLYEGVAHTPAPALEDIVEFHRRSLDGESVSSFDQTLGFEPVLEQTAEQAAIGEAIEFDASSTAIGLGNILAHIWEFSDGETRTGQVVTRRFDTAGEYSVELTVIDDNGREATTETTVVVGENVEQTASGTGTERDTPSTTPRETGRATDQDRRITLPGIGVGVAGTSLIGGGFLALRDRFGQ